MPRGPGTTPLRCRARCPSSTHQAIHLLPGLHTAQTHCALEPRPVCYASHCWPPVPRPAWALPRRRTAHSLSVPHPERSSQSKTEPMYCILTTKHQLTSRYSVRLLDVNKYCICVYCDCHYKQSYSIPHLDWHGPQVWLWHLENKKKLSKLSQKENLHGKYLGISETGWDIENQIQWITYGKYKDLDLHEIQDTTMGWACTKIPSRLHTQKSHEACVHWQSTSGDTDKWEEGVKEDATRILWCRNWKLTMQNRAVWSRNYGSPRLDYRL
jgi:hypothetical protein